MRRKENRNGGKRRKNHVKCFVECSEKDEMKLLKTFPFISEKERIAKKKFSDVLIEEKKERICHLSTIKE